MTRYRAMLVATPREGYAGACEALAAWDFREELGSIRAPTRVVAGADDPATPCAQAEFLCDRIPAADLVVLQGAAHLANVEQPAEFTGSLVESLSSTRTTDKVG